MKMPTSRSSKGFSLVEVSLSLAIIAAVLLPIIALLAGGSGIVADSEDRFAASGVAGSIISQLRYSPEKKGFVVLSGDTSESQLLEETVVPLPASGNTSEVFLGYDRYGLLQKTLNKKIFETGTNSDDSEVFYLVHLKISGGEKGFSVGQGAPSLYRASLSVEAPAFTSEINRSKQKLTTLLSAGP